MSKKTKLAVVEKELVRLDFGCGKNPKEGFDGVDQIDFGQKHIWNLAIVWPIGNESVAEVHSSHFLEHLTGEQRILFFNELGRVLVPGGKATIITPHASHVCAYGDPTHQWPPITEWSYQYTNKAWRDGNAPHVAMTCDFDFSYGYGPDQRLNGRNPEFVQMAIQTQWNAARDLHVTMTKRMA